MKRHRVIACFECPYERALDGYLTLLREQISRAVVDVALC
ncbi:hypothetical protein AWB69_01228 [Caballeronia udeis]|uniref:Uncharacterized protein n=1 Tax=Caballeronia udeis TaxID=1232866 RepID=A0A158FJT2_9BURK|nr:hypothetical protein AWB69_01228 [Caballeronia udeis]